LYNVKWSVRRVKLYNVKWRADGTDTSSSYEGIPMSGNAPLRIVWLTIPVGYLQK